MSLFKPFVDGIDSIEYEQCVVFHFNLRFRMQTVIAISTILGHFFTEIVQQHTHTAQTWFGIRRRFEQKLLTDFLFRNRLAFHKFFQTKNVLIAIECDTLSFASVTAGTTCFLIIAFERFWYIIMYDKTHIGFVYTHTERNGSHNHIDFLHQKHILIFRTRMCIQSSMIRQSLNTVHDQRIGKLFDFFTAQTINDTRFPRILLYELYDLLGCIDLRTDFVVQIFTAERRLEHLCIKHAQILLYIVLDLRRRRRCQSNNRSTADVFDCRFYFSVFRAEIMSPLRNTVCFVNCVEGNLYAP